VNDFFGQPLSIGDEVAFEQPGYRNLIKGKIVSFTPKFVNVQWTNPIYADHPHGTQKFRVSPSDVVRSPRKTLELMGRLLAVVPVESQLLNHSTVDAVVAEINNGKA
jgi:hypothetical protein